VVRSLLDAHSASHDEHQKALESTWDVFLKQRSKALKASKSGRSSVSQPGLANKSSSAAALLGLQPSKNYDEEGHDRDIFIGFTQLATSEERRELDKLVRLGVPLAYKKSIWAECSGVLELAEPGIFADLLAVARTGSGAERDIEKDIRRTMPGNVFFGGQGPGVEKLRRVLLAYSR
jgi:small G protein signaling modulator 3